MHVPGWHERTRPWRAAGELQLVGIAQEQHPDRCRLFAQWKGLDWPILWDPFNLTGAAAVPRVFAVDEHGVVRAIGPRPEALREDFLERVFERPAGLPPAAPASVPLLVGTPDTDDLVGLAWRAMASMLWEGEAAYDRGVGALEALVRARPKDGPARFRLGVAHRMRFDSDAARPGDFQRALEAWSAALALDPNQYIWRRRIQQYGPRLDKPYPFYDWVSRARSEIRDRGEEPVPLEARLTGAEIAHPAEGPVAAAGSGGGGGAAEPAAPDPEGRIRRDGGEWLELESAVALDSTRERPVARVHLALRPREETDAHWNNEAGPLLVWIGDPELPRGWSVGRRLLELPVPPQPTSREVRHADFEVTLPAPGESGTLSGYVLFYGCEGVEGKCVYRRRDFEVSVAVPE